MIAYRPHRGSLADAMKEAKTFLNEWQMKCYVANNWNLAIGRKVLAPKILLSTANQRTMIVSVGKMFTWFVRLESEMTIT